jgi:hypothetical protein
MVCDCKKCAKKCHSSSSTNCDTKCDTKCESKCNISCEEGLKQIDAIFTKGVTDLAHIFDGIKTSDQQITNALAFLLSVPVLLSNIETSILEGFVWLQLLGLSGSTSNELLDALSNYELPAVELITCQAPQCCLDCPTVLASFTAANELIRKTKFDVANIVSTVSGSAIFTGQTPTIQTGPVGYGIGSGDTIDVLLIVIAGLVAAILVQFGNAILEMLLMIHNYTILFFLCDKCAIKIIYQNLEKQHALWLNSLDAIENTLGLIGVELPTTLFDTNPPYTRLTSFRTESNNKMNNRLADMADAAVNLIQTKLNERNEAILRARNVL